MTIVLYENADRSVSFLIPTDEVLKFTTINQVAVKDVPHGLPFWIVDDSVIPSDWSDRNQWRLDGSQGEPDGYGGESSEFPAEVLP